MNKTIHILLATTVLSGMALSSSIVSANTEVIDTVELTVPIACTMSGTGTTHTATLNPGTYSGASGSEYENGIGKTTLTAICNDDNGFSIYAIGYTGNQYEGENHTKLVGTNTNGTIATKAYASGDTTSNWSMKLTKVTNPSSGDPVTYNPENLTITTNYDNWIAVPATYTKVAQYKANTGSSTTDTTLGVKLETTYAAYIASNQAADTYVGQVKYTMVHPYDETPAQAVACVANKICYNPNSNLVEGTMGQQSQDDNSNTIVDGATVTLLASNYSRNGYGFAGWSDKFDYATNNEAHFYGPQETITAPTGTTTNGFSLYAIWVPSAGSLQDSSKVSELCGTGANTLTTAPTDGTANLSSVSALTDQRDNQTYAIAKLSDGKCWMIENLRLESANSDNSTGALAQGYGASATYGNFSGLANAESTGFTDTYIANSLYYSGTQEGSASVDIGSSDYPGFRMPRYNNLNTQSRGSSPTNNTFSSDNTTGGMYSYGNYYTWHAAIADTTAYILNGTDQSVTDTSLCPTGWRLPRGGNKLNEANNEFWSLVVTGINSGTNPANYENSNSPNYNGVPEGSGISNKLRSYPNNFLYSGFIIDSSINNRGRCGQYWSSTSLAYNSSYGPVMCTSQVYPGNGPYNKFYGLSVRCMTDN